MLGRFYLRITFDYLVYVCRKILIGEVLLEQEERQVSLRAIHAYRREHFARPGLPNRNDSIPIVVWVFCFERLNDTSVRKVRRGIVARIHRTLHAKTFDEEVKRMDAHALN